MRTASWLCIAWVGTVGCDSGDDGPSRTSLSAPGETGVSGRTDEGTDSVDASGGLDATESGRTDAGTTGGSDGSTTASTGATMDAGTTGAGASTTSAGSTTAGTCMPGACPAGQHCADGTGCEPGCAAATDCSAPASECDTRNAVCVAPGTDLSQLCVDEINMYRATLTLTPMDPWSEQITCASGQARDDAATGMLHDNFGRCGEAAQTECPDFRGDPVNAMRQCLQSMWAEGPGGIHYDIMSSGFGRVACGFHQTAGGRWWIVQDFR